MTRLVSSVLFSAALSMSAATYDLKLTPANVHWGYYDARIKPVLRIASGDTVRVETMVAGGLDRLTLAGVPDSEIPESLKLDEKSVTDRGPGAHPLTGPIYVEGAEPGDVIEMKMLGFEYLHPYGVTGFRPGSGTLRRNSLESGTRQLSRGEIIPSSLAPKPPHGHASASGLPAAEKLSASNRAPEAPL